MKTFVTFMIGALAGIVFWDLVTHDTEQFSELDESIRDWGGPRR